jgi:hypothetical protein
LPVENEAKPITVDDIDRATENVPASGSDTPVTAEDWRNAYTRLSQENASLKEELDKTLKRVQTIEILDDLIEPMAKRSFTFMCSYCGVVGAMVLAHGLKICGFSLPESVLQFLVGSTAATVIGLVGMVLTGVFIGARRNGRD